MSILWEENFECANESGYNNHKDIVIKKILGIQIENFRTIKNRNIELGRVTVLAGKNGTMKSTILGLIAHPFESPNDAKDVYGQNLKTKMSDVFTLSEEKDKEKYNYNILVETKEGKRFKEPIRVYPRLKEDKESYRHRVTVGSDNSKGKGNFSLNTKYINLKRLYPMVDTHSKKEQKEVFGDVSDMEKFVHGGYQKILQKTEFKNANIIQDKNIKKTLGPSDDASYNFESISSGEDNLGHILTQMYAFITNRTDRNNENLNGIFCIDEFEASMHPVAQVLLFNFIYNWAVTYNIQVVLTTHSLFLVQNIIKEQKRKGEHNDIVLNIISTAYVDKNNYQIIKNPTYKIAYKELTLSDEEGLKKVYKVNVICEDKIAKEYLNKLLFRKTEIKKRINIIDSLMEEYKDGNSCVALKSLLLNGGTLLDDSIVVFDHDVLSMNLLSQLKKVEDKWIVLPGLYEMAFEKEIAKFIYNLPGDNIFFEKMRNEKNVYLMEFARYNIDLSTSDENIAKTSVKNFKNWAINDKNFKKYLQYYIKENSLAVDKFVKDFTDKLNNKFRKNGLPEII